ncbi:MAG: MATE family efflux transporter [Ruminiclostridium sp.]|nr:MATE family efflux transporter [Ruminiclostridium sp.]
MEKEKNPLGTEPVGRLMLRFAVPSIIAMLVGALYNIVDQLFIGHAVGTDGNAATNIAFPLTTMCMSLALLFGVGGASCYNLALGREEKEKAPYFIGNAVTMLSVCGIVLGAVTLVFLDPMLTLFGANDAIMPYAEEYVSITAFGFPFLLLTAGGGHIVRADGSPGMTMLCSIVGAVVNTALDALFVFGFGWGMAGAAAATIIGQIISALIVLWYVFFRFHTSKLEKKHFLPSKHIFRMISIGLASFFNQIAIMAVQIVVNTQLRDYGDMSEYGSTVTLACAGIIMKVNQIVFSFSIGLAQGSQPIESFNYGARRYPRVRKAYLLASGTSMLIAFAAFIFFQTIPRQILSLFGEGTEQYFAFGEFFFRVFLFFVPLVSLQPVTSVFFTSIGKPVKGIILSLTRQIIFFIPLVLILPLFYGIEGVVYAGPAADIITLAVTLFMAFGELSAMKKLETADSVPVLNKS